VGIGFRYAGLSKRTDNPACGGTSSRAYGSGSQPACRNYRTETRYSKQAETGEQARCAADTGANACALSGAFSTIVDAVMVAILLVTVEPAVRVVGDDADV
jgi:hypothetical protein